MSEQIEAQPKQRLSPWKVFAFVLVWALLHQIFRFDFLSELSKIVLYLGLAIPLVALWVLLEPKPAFSLEQARENRTTLLHVLVIVTLLILLIRAVDYLSIGSFDIALPEPPWRFPASVASVGAGWILARLIRARRTAAL